MEIWNNVWLGLQTAAIPVNLWYCLLGAMLGTAIGILPGIAPVTTIALLLPVTFGLDATSALIMLAGIYYGAQYGGSTTAILVNTPGEASSVVTAIDGYQMAKRGQAGRALAAAAIASFVAGTIATFLIVLFAPMLAEVALKFGPAEYFSLMVLGLVAAIVLASGSLLHAFGMVLLGLLLGMVGTDVNSGVIRYDFGFGQLGEGLDFVVVAMGIFGISEVLANVQNRTDRNELRHSVERLMPTASDLKRIIAPTLRGTALGSVLGILPGGGALLGAFAAYAVEKKVSRNASEFGHGAIEGVAAPEAANNAGAQTSFIPMLTLGIPANPTMAMMISAMIIQGIQPGPAVITEQPTLFWGLVASMWIGNAMLVVLNLPLVGLWVKMISIPYHFLFPMIVLFCVIGVYSVSNNEFGLYLLLVFSVLGFFLRRMRVEPTPMLLAFILGPMMEEYLRRALLMSGGSAATLVTHPTSAVLLLISVLLLAMVLAPTIRKKREEAFQEE